MISDNGTEEYISGYKPYPLMTHASVSVCTYTEVWDAQSELQEKLKIKKIIKRKKLQRKI